MMKCGLLGEKLGHSYSPQIHKRLGDYPYDLYEIPRDRLVEFLKEGDFTGLNVTIPYKKEVIPYLDDLSPVAKRLGAVNVIVRRQGRLIGHNTDYFGFATMLRSSGLAVAGKKALVLGSGGASSVAAAVLQEQGANVVIISRSGANHYGNLHLHKDAALIVNATPVGMYPNVNATPIDLSLFPQLEGVLDAIYNPSRTQLLMDAEARGLVAINGTLMLVAQAIEASEWFTESTISDDSISRIHAQLRNQTENIILIGMPGSGKSTVGAILAQKTGKALVDTDEEIIKRTGMSIPEIFATQGEDAFRRLETSVLKELGMRSGLIIATGGGCVTREENYAHLHRNGRIFCLERDLDKLPSDGRPLSQKTPAEEMYRVRKPLYTRFADYHIDSNSSTEAAAGEILRIWEECI